jgi:hypothetical protein
MENGGKNSDHITTSAPNKGGQPPGQKKKVGDGNDGEKHIFSHNFFVSTTIDTLPMTDMFALASRMH